MTRSLEDYLAQSPVFSTLDAADRTQLARQSIPRNYEKGEWMVHYGEIWPYLLWVEEGTVTALKESNEGRSLIVTTINSGEIFWGTAFFLDDAPIPVALVAYENSRIRLWSRERLMPFLLKNGKMSWELSRLMVNRMQHASEMVEELAFQPIPGRLARLLIDRYSGGEGPVARDLTLDEMAAHIGSTREMVCRALYRFADDGMIEITRTEFLFTDEEKLKDLAFRTKG